jgi:transcriptional regulator with XRE-family HTH domain
VAGTRRNPVHEATLQADWLLREIGRELRLARLSAGKTQSKVAAAIGRSQAAVSLVERGRDPSATLDDLARQAAGVKMRLWARVFPDGRATLDAPQLNLLGRFRPRLHEAWTWELEVPVPLPGDLRAGDCRLTIPGCTILVEAITRLADAQAQTRAAQRKRRDLGCDRLILLLADTGTNRRAVRDAGPAYAAAFPISPRAALRALAEGGDPGGDALILL